MMKSEALRKLVAIGLFTVTGCSWATISVPEHETPKWQDISSITWSTDGTNWGNSALVVGQSVEFKFTMHKENVGNHYADLIKAWIDLDGDEQLANSEVLLFGYHVVHNSPVEKKAPEQLANQSFDFISGPINLTSAMVGNHFLLARVTCSESLMREELGDGPWARQWDSTYTANNNAWYNQYFSPTLSYWQGDAHLVKLTVNNEAPEPGTLALLAVAMVGMGLRRKRAGRL